MRLIVPASLLLLLLTAACQSTPAQPATSSPDAEVPTTTPPPPAEERGVITGATSPDADPAACEALGGSCTGVGSCTQGQGHHAMQNTCGAAYLVCCIPEGKCGGPEDFSCCDGSAGFRPGCLDGKLVCREGQQRCEE